MRAHASVRVELGDDGSPLVTELRSQVPLVLRRTTAADSTFATWGLPTPEPTDRLPTVVVHLVNAAAGPLAGDELRLDVRVGFGVHLVLRSVAATVALPGHGPRPSTTTVTADVADGAILDYLPEPTVAAYGCRHRSVAEVSLGAGAFLRWREEILLGRFDEPAGAIWTSLRVDTASLADGQLAGRRPLLRQELDLAPDAPGLHGPAVLGSARAVGSLLVAGPGPDGLAAEAYAGPGVAVMPLAGPGVLVSALADDAVTMRRRLRDPRGVAGPDGRQNTCP